MIKPNNALTKVLQYQQEVKCAEESIVTLKAAIEAQRDSIQRANSFTTNVPELLTQRENLLADIAVGKKDKSKLDSLNVEIDEAQKQLETNSANASKIVPEAKATIAGLERKLQTAEEALSDLIGKKPDVLYEFLLSEAEQIGAEYAAACSTVAAKHRQLLAIDGIIGRITGYDRRKTILPVCNVELELPLFKIECVKALAGPCQPGYEARVYEAEKTKLVHVVDSEREKQRERIMSLGVNL